MSNSKDSIEYVRQKQLPVFLKIQTARYREHVGPGEDFNAGYRSEDEMNKWKSKDPLFTWPGKDDAKKITVEEIHQALDFAQKSPFPTMEELLTDVY